MPPDHNHFEKGKKEARIGLDSEQNIINRINSDKEFHNDFRNCLRKLGFTVKEKLKANRNKVKTDIFIWLSEEEFIGASIKSSTGTSFHQLDRRRLEDWKNYLNMPDDVFETIKKAILRVAKYSKDKFILEEDQEKIRNFLFEHRSKIIKEIFQKDEKELEVFIINDVQKKKLYVFRMKDVIDFLVENINKTGIRFTKKGIIQLGSFITVQRKGGDGKHITIPKTAWSHPGNQLQFKFSPLKFTEYIESTGAIEFCSVNY